MSSAGRLLDQIHLFDPQTHQPSHSVLVFARGIFTLVVSTADSLDEFPVSHTDLETQAQALHKAILGYTSETTVY